MTVVLMSAGHAGGVLGGTINNTINNSTINRNNNKTNRICIFSQFSEFRIQNMHSTFICVFSVKHASEYDTCH